MCLFGSLDQHQPTAYSRSIVTAESAGRVSFCWLAGHIPTPLHASAGAGFPGVGSVPIPLAQAQVVSA